MRILTQLEASSSPEVLFFHGKSLLFPTASPLSVPESSALAEILAQTESGPYGDGDTVDLQGRLFLLMDAGKEKPLSREENLRCAAFRLVGVAQHRHLSPTIALAEVPSEDCSAILEGLHYGEYRFDKYKSKPNSLRAVSWTLVVGKRTNEIRNLANRVALVLDSVKTARDLVNEPGSVLTPQAFISKAKSLAKTHGLKVSVRNATQLQREGFLGLISVGKGSLHSPAMVTLRYQPRNARSHMHLGLVGKGITFDTGGISLKPAADMWEMKNDMAGAATALSAICAIADLKLPIQVTAVLCIAENRPSGTAQLPGDIFTAKNGKTVMVDNTDAEGRLVLTDGLWECGNLGVTHLVDLATLTGAVVRALGSYVAGLFTNSPAMGEMILNAGQSCGEKFWPLPLEREYMEGLRDKIADLRNVSGEVGAVTAALFLSEFTPPRVAWAHLDIAGTAFTKKGWKYFEHGATGFGTQTLVELAQLLADPTNALPPPPPDNLEEKKASSRRTPPKARPAQPVPRSTVTPKHRQGMASGRTSKKSSKGPS
ncbi:MAG TPA: leucyl aminopeptidase family protein [Fibrobacteraceae bacterium]|nr:leucyl aminopeptidase family protein [Fibrobacteraceae bacterium]